MAFNPFGDGGKLPPLEDVDPFGQPRSGFNPFGDSGSGGRFNPFGMQGGKPTGQSIGELQGRKTELEGLAQQHEVFETTRDALVTGVQYAGDMLSRGSYASAGFAQELLRGNGVGAAVQRSLKELFHGMPGVQGERRTYEAVLRDLGVTEQAGVPAPFGLGKITARGVEGLALDIALDPLTYVTFGAAPAFVMISRQGGKALGKVSLTKAGKALVNDIARNVRPDDMELAKWMATGEIKDLPGAPLGSRQWLENSVQRDITRLQIGYREAGDRMWEKIQAGEAQGLIDEGGIKWFGKTVVPGQAFGRPLKYTGGKLAKVLDRVPAYRPIANAAGVVARELDSMFNEVRAVSRKLPGFQMFITERRDLVHAAMVDMKKGIKEMFPKEMDKLVVDTSQLPGVHPSLAKVDLPLGTYIGQHLDDPGTFPPELIPAGYMKSVEQARALLRHFAEHEMNTMGTLPEKFVREFYFPHHYGNTPEEWEEISQIVGKENMQGLFEGKWNWGPHNLERGFKTFNEGLQYVDELKAQGMLRKDWQLKPVLDPRQAIWQRSENFYSAYTKHHLINQLKAAYGHELAPHLDRALQQWSPNLGKRWKDAPHEAFVQTVTDRADIPFVGRGGKLVKLYRGAKPVSSTQNNFAKVEEIPDGVRWTTDQAHAQQQAKELGDKGWAVEEMRVHEEDLEGFRVSEKEFNVSDEAIAEHRAAKRQKREDHEALDELIGKQIGADYLHHAAVKTADGQIFEGSYHMDASSKADEAGANLDDAVAGFMTTKGKFIGGFDAAHAQARNQAREANKASYNTPTSRVTAEDIIEQARENEGPINVGNMGPDKTELMGVITRLRRAHVDGVRGLKGERAWLKKQSPEVKSLYILSRLRQVSSWDEFDKFMTTMKDDITALDPGMIARTRAAMAGEQRKVIKSVDSFGEPHQLVTNPKSPFKGLIIPGQVDHELNRLQTGFIDLRQVHHLIKTLDVTQDLFKVGVTVGFPAFHVRNAYSNVVQNFVALGLQGLNPFAYMRAGHIMMPQHYDGTIMVGGRKYTYQHIRAMMQRFGIVKDFEEIMELTRSGQKGLRAKLSGEEKFHPVVEVLGGPLLYPGRKYMKGMSVVGGQIENTSRVMLFISELERFGDPTMAAMRVKKFLFDYEQLSPIERNVLTRIFPFYKWTKKNIALTLDEMKRQPGKYAAMFKLGNPAEEGPEHDALPWYLKGALKVKLKKHGNAVFLTGIDLPVHSALSTIFNGSVMDTMRQNAGMLTPVLKIAIEMGMGKEAFSGRDMNERQQIHGFMQVVNVMPPQIKQWLEYSAAPIQETGEMQYTINGTKAYLLMRSWAHSRIINTWDKTAREDRPIQLGILQLLTGLQGREMDLTRDQKLVLRRRIKLLEDRLIQKGALRGKRVAYQPEGAVYQ